MKIVLLSIHDCAGSLRHMSKALAMSGHCVTLVASGVHGFLTEFQRQDYLLNCKYKDTLDADLIITKGDELPLDIYNKCVKEYPLQVYTQDLKIKTVHIISGSGARRMIFSDIKNDGVSVSKSFVDKTRQQWYEIEDYKKQCSKLFCLTPDLLVNGVDAYLPQCYTTNKFSYVSRKRFVVTHSPSNRQKKGTDKIQEAVNIVKKEMGDVFDFRIISGVDNEECVNMKRLSNLFIDQFNNIGFYGMSALEAMSFGIPVMSNISEFAFKKFGDDVHVSSPRNNAKSIAISIMSYLKINDRDREKKNAKRVYDFFKTYHSYDAFHKRLINLL
jgi:hypothetical protein